MITVIIILLSLGLVSTIAQTQSVSPEMQTANELFQAQKWPEAAAAYEAIAKAEPKNGQAWFRYGSALMSLNKFEESIAPLTKAAEVLNGPMAFYTLGSAYAKLDSKERAFEYLNKAAAAGFAQFNRLKNDPNLAGLRDTSRFNAVFENVERNARPCKYMPEAKQFDFWVGEWDVQANGRSLGTNVIQRLEEGCLIMENWTGAGGSTGKSMNFYNPVLKKWRQTYMSNNQVVWEMSGEYKDGAMRYEGEVIPPNGTKTLTRVVFYNQGPDKLRHTEDDSTDGGKTWTNVWDAIYVRKKPAPVGN